MTDAARIFVVEDEALIALELTMRLEALGYVVCGRAASGEKAMQGIPGAKPDLVLMDVNLQTGMDGIEVADWIRRRVDVPVVFLTAYSDDALIGRAAQVSPFGYLVKPFEERELHATIQAALSRHLLETRLREANTALAASERFALDVIDAMGAPVAVLDERGVIVAANAPWRTASTATPDTFCAGSTGESYLVLCRHAAALGRPDASEMAGGLTAVLSGAAKNFTHLYPVQGASGPGWFQCRIEQFGADPRRVVVIHEDVSAIHAAFEEAARRRREFSSFADSAPIGIFRTNVSGGWVQASERVGELIGASASDVLGDRWLELVHPDDRKGVRQWADETLPEFKQLETEIRFVHADGSERWLLTQAFPVTGADGSFDGLIGSLTDITERKRIEMAMHFLSSEVAGLEGASYFEVAALRLASLLRVDATFVVLGGPGEPAQLRALATVVDGALRANFAFPAAGTPWADAVAGQVLILDRGASEQYPALRYLLDEEFEFYAAVPLTDASGQVVGGLGAMSRKPLPVKDSLLTVLRLFAEGASRAIMREQSRRQYLDLWEFAPDALVLADEEGRITLANRRAAEVFGWDLDELIGQPIEMLLPLHARARHVDLRRSFAHAPERRKMGSARGDLFGVRKDGSEFDADIELAPVRFEGRSAIAAAVRDVSERKAMERRIAQSTKMDALGRLTGGIAHDFNNYLGVIIGNLELLKDRRALSGGSRGIGEQRASGCAYGRGFDAQFAGVCAASAHRTVHGGYQYTGVGGCEANEASIGGPHHNRHGFGRGPVGGVL